MTPLSLKLPRGAEIAFNSLYDSKQPILLIQDVLFVSLPNDIYIDVGWYPEHDPSGAYRISAYRAEWWNRLIEPIRTVNAYEAADVVSRLAKTLLSQVVTRISRTSGAVVASGSNTVLNAEELQLA